MTTYDEDFVAWSLEQADALRQGRDDLLDRANLAEEVEALAKRERRELASRLTVLLTHLIKWDQQPHERSHSWWVTILIQREEISDLLEDSPSLRPLVPKLVEQRWGRAVRRAAHEMRRSAEQLEVSAWPAEQVLDDDFWPERPRGE